MHPAPTRLPKTEAENPEPFVLRSNSCPGHGRISHRSKLPSFRHSLPAWAASPPTAVTASLRSLAHRRRVCRPSRRRSVTDTHPHHQRHLRGWPRLPCGRLAILSGDADDYPSPPWNCLPQLRLANRSADGHPAYRPTEHFPDGRGYRPLSWLRHPNFF